MNPFTTVKKGSEAMLLMSTLKRRLNSAIDIVISDLTLDSEVPRKNLVRYTDHELRLDKKALSILLATGSNADELDYAKLRTLGESMTSSANL